MQEFEPQVGASMRSKHKEPEQSTQLSSRQLDEGDHQPRQFSLGVPVECRLARPSLLSFSMLTSTWNSLIDTFSDFTLMTIGTFIVHETVWLIVNLFCILCPIFPLYPIVQPLFCWVVSVFFFLFCWFFSWAKLLTHRDILIDEFGLFQEYKIQKASTAHRFSLSSCINQP